MDKSKPRHPLLGGGACPLILKCVSGFPRDNSVLWNERDSIDRSDIRL